MNFCYVVGAVISPTLMNITLDGMEDAVKSITKPSDKVNFIRYADDFIVTANSTELLESKVKPAIQAFLSERGLSLSLEKTRVAHIDDGFDFLGFNVRKYSGKLLIKPSKASIKSLLQTIRAVIKNHHGSNTVSMLRQLNPIIRGWSNYYKGAVAKEIFDYVDHKTFLAIWRWCKRRHPNKCANWVKRKYFRRRGYRDWVLSTTFCRADGELKVFDLFEASCTRIKRHVKIRASANPYDEKYKEYFEQRERKRFKMPTNYDNLVSSWVA